MQNTIDFPHFQYRPDGKKRVTLFSLQFNEDDMYHVLSVQFGDLKTTLNAHDARKLFERNAVKQLPRSRSSST